MTATPVPSVAPIADTARATTDLITGSFAKTSGVNGFAQLLVTGIDHVDQKLKAADKLTEAFALDDSIPLHQVTFALQQARLSLELMMQVRARLVEAYQQFAGMQL
jgi:flagellar hook-basal body complex protein FliE